MMRRSSAGAGELSVPRLTGSRSLIVVLAIVVAGAACAAPAFAGDAKSDTKKKPPTASPVAHAMVPEVAVFETPAAEAPKLTLTDPTATEGKLVFLVDAVQAGGWVEVLLPIRPNGSTGWIRASDVSIKVNTFRIQIDLSDHSLVAFNKRKKFLETSVGIGKGNTPTPGGRYFTTQLFAPPNPDGPYGPYAFALSGFSEVLTTFRGGDAIIGLHGTNKPELVGQDVSAGCIRLKNEDIEALAAVLPLGTPVEIRA